VLPNIAEQLLPRLDAAAPLGQERQKLKLRRGQFNAFAMRRDQVFWNINVEVAGANDIALLLARLAALEQALDAQHQFTRTERLGHIIIRAQFKTQYAIDFRRLGREHQNRYPGDRRIAPQNLADFESI